MNKRFLALAGVAAVLSVGTYVGLNIVKPYKHEEPKVADVTSPDQVFGASVDNPEAHANEAGAAPAAVGAAPGDVAAVQPTDTAVQPASPAGAAPAPSAEAPAAASAGDGSTAPLVPAGAAGAAPAPSTETAAAPAAEAPAPAPAPEPAPAPAAEPAPAPAAAAAAPAEKPKKKHSASAGKSSSKSSSGSSAKVWWPAPKDDKLSLVYAGSASYKKAVVLMFNGAFFKADTINANIKVTDKSGKAVAGELGENNLRMVVFPVSAAGSYKVSIASGLTDNKGRKLGSKLSGSVSVK